MNACLSLLKEDEGQVMKASGSRLLSEHPAIFFVAILKLWHSSLYIIASLMGFRECIFRDTRNCYFK